MAWCQHGPCACLQIALGFPESETTLWDLGQHPGQPVTPLVKSPGTEYCARATVASAQGTTAGGLEAAAVSVPMYIALAGPVCPMRLGPSPRGVQVMRVVSARKSLSSPSPRSRVTRQRPRRQMATAGAARKEQTRTSWEGAFRPLMPGSWSRPGAAASRRRGRVVQEGRAWPAPASGLQLRQALLPGAGGACVGAGQQGRTPGSARCLIMPFPTTSYLEK